MLQWQIIVNIAIPQSRAYKLELDIFDGAMTSCNSR